MGADRVESLAPYSGSYNAGTIKYRAGSSIQNITMQQLASSTNWLLTLLCKPMYILTHTIQQLTLNLFMQCDLSQNRFRFRK